MDEGEDERELVPDGMTSTLGRRGFRRGQDSPGGAVRPALSVPAG